MFVNLGETSMMEIKYFATLRTVFNCLDARLHK